MVQYLIVGTFPQCKNTNQNEEQMSTKKVTVIDVAKRAGVSRSSASRVLSRSGFSSQEVKEKVLKAAKDLNYQQNILAKALRGDIIPIAGLIVPDLANGFWVEVAKSIQNYLDSQGWSLVILDSNWDKRKEKEHLKRFRSLHIQSVILNSINICEQDLNKEGLENAVFIGSKNHDNNEYSSVQTDLQQAISLAIDYFASLGRLNIGCILGYQRRANQQVKEILSRYANMNFYFEDGDYSTQGGKKAAESLLKKHTNINGIFALNDLMAMGTIMALNEMSISCPDDISVIGNDGIAAGQYIVPQLTTIKKPMQEMGEKAATILLNQVKNNSAEITSITLPCSLHQGGSTKRLEKEETTTCFQKNC